jgi:hypothetical protein
MVQCFSNATARLPELVLSQLERAVGDLQPQQIVLKPNWVHHEKDAAFPISALVTDVRVIAAAVRACLRLFPKADSITVADCPLQQADWALLCRQSGLTALISELEREAGGRVVFRDLRREVFKQEEGSFLVAAPGEHGDPRGYREVLLGARSHLEPISDQADNFGVNDYTARITRSNHRASDHRYLVSQTVLDADLFINLPKWKTHAKSGLTCALKNLVGVNGDKAYLPHFRRGAPRWGGDEYWDRGRWLYWAQTALRESFQKRSRWAYKLLKPGWEFLKKRRGLETRFDNPHATPRDFYVGGGSWYGNQTIWRMIYDLNLVIQCADRQGRLQATPQRHYVCVVDGLISGQGNGPLQPLPRATDWLAFGDNPFTLDTALGWFMGFDPAKVPLLARHGDYLGPSWGGFDLSVLKVAVDGQTTRLLDSAVNFQFVPPPSWKGHIERESGLTTPAA